ncbi:selenocysteine-specific translation elongation factor [Hyphomicrobium denitrificans 1NES1]|uniref:Selenocysteine-specific elongation factor n=1 Tax=Hyphomicrobium denitrificans 1NES1 TaxID=670307 RepID=N0B1F6_9HYPH|nr:selenocysteine-specific translation elongation factor [Hyphomicrobium denitrificans 1NES1]
MIIGTAGHIDHGKTALVKALTGVEGDRLKEEKARGITIDLGFAYLPTSQGLTLGFIDVPGHERFVHTMVAGASGIDFAMLTVAADDGIKPQTLEHLSIIDLLGIARGIVVITKKDLTTADCLSKVAADIKALTVGTTLETADVVAVSAITGDGIDALRERLVDAAAKIGQHPADGRFRLAVDRAFTLQGIGVVVTGTVLSGRIEVGNHVRLSPSGLIARVRSIHAQNQPAEFGKAGDRCALNLTGPEISKDAIHRGDVVLDPELHAPTDRIDAVLRILQREEKPISQWFPIRLHHGAAEIGAHIALLGDKPIPPGATTDVQLVLDEPIAAAVPDRFVIRDVSGRRTIGGGKFIDLRPPARKRRTPERQAQRAAMTLDDATKAFSALLAAPPFAVDVSSFARDRALSEKSVEQIKDELAIVTFGTDESAIAVSLKTWQTFATDLKNALGAFHADNPDRQGIGREQLRLMLQPRLSKPSFAVALQKAAESGDIALDGAFVRLSSHQARLSTADEATWQSIAPLLGGDERFRPPRVRDIAEVIDHSEHDVRRLFKLAGRAGWVDEIAHDHFFLRGTVQEMLATAIDISRKSEAGFFTAADLRDRLSNGRKVAIQILEFFDRHGVTLRKGDMRTLNKHRLDLFGALVHSSAQTSGGESSPVGRSDFKSEWGSEPALGGFDSHSPPPVISRKR